MWSRRAGAKPLNGHLSEFTFIAQCSAVQCGVVHMVVVPGINLICVSGLRMPKSVPISFVSKTSAAAQTIRLTLSCRCIIASASLPNPFQEWEAATACLAFQKVPQHLQHLHVACCMLLLPRSPQIRPTVCKLRTLRRFRQVIPCGICRIRFAEACAISRLMPVFTLLINAPVRLKLLRLLLLVFLFVRNQGLRMFRHRWEERKRRAAGL